MLFPTHPVSPFDWKHTLTHCLIYGVHYKAPTYIIWGANDELTPVRTGKALLAKLSGVKLEIIEDAGHTPIRDQEILFHQAVQRALVFVPEQEPIKRTLKSVRNGSCNNRSGIIFSGNYKSINIRRCTDVLLQGVTAEYVHVFGSNIVIENSQIHGEGIGLFADHAKIFATDLTIDADVAISASGSRFDLAAVELLGRKAAVQTTEQSFLLFSVSRIDSPFLKGDIHGVRRVTEDSPI
jgi:hypothetical protein